MPLPLDLRLLWYFKRTAEIGSLTKAAAELGTSQPALTRHIMRLEHELRAALLLRDQRGVTPTEAGALVLDKAANLLRLEQAMKADIGALSHTIAGDVSLCMPSSLYWVVTAPVTNVVAAKFPDIRLRLMDGFDHLSRAQLKSRLADLGVIVYDPESILDGIDCRPVATEQLCLIGSTPSPINNLSLTWAVAVQETRARSPVVAAVAQVLQQHISSWIGGSDLVHAFST
jgi:LysR family nitrogen assimilation transcriptional regulator